MPKIKACRPSTGARAIVASTKVIVAGYFLEAAIAHFNMTDGKDRRMYDAAKKLADCWCDHLGPPPKKTWYDGHQEMEQALVRFARLVDQVEGAGRQ